MKLNQLRLENFKIFQNVKINFKPLTLLTGTNSSGKSTILNAITSILQSQPPDTFPFSIVPNGETCSIGGFKDIVKGKNTRTKFLIGISLIDDENLIEIDGRYRYSSSGNHILPDKVSYKYGTDGFELEWLGQDNGYRAIYYTEKYNEMLEKDIMIKLRSVFDTIAISISSEKGEKDKQINFEKAFEKHTSNWIKLKAKNPYEVTDEIKKESVGKYLIGDLERNIEKLERNFKYVGPVRVHPSRYYLTGVSNKHIDSIGKNSISILYDWKKHYPKKYSEVIKSIQLLELASKVDTKTSLDEILKLDVQPFKHSESVNFVDVGFGISQVLPILVADTSLPKNGTLLVNQPEVHLHPSSQALLGDYFVSRLKNRNYILETHSEYLINRLRLLSVQKKVDTKDIQIIFIESGDKNSSNPIVHTIEIGDNGSLINAPDSFFKTYFLDTFNIAMGGELDEK